MPSQIIQWFPGHMAKTRRLISENLKQVDAVIEIVDARIPYSSHNPEIMKITAGKPMITLLNKASLADPEKTAAILNGDFLSETSNGIGIANVHRRLQLLYGSKYGIRITTRPNEGFHVMMKLKIDKT